LCLLLACSIAACAAPATKAPPAAIRLAELFEPSAVVGTAAAPAAQSPRSEWKFDAPAQGGLPQGLGATLGWEAADGITGLAVREGRLTGRTTSAFPVLRLLRTSGLENQDLFNSIEIRLRVSAGANLAVRLLGDESTDITREIAEMHDERLFRWRWRMRTPVTAGETVRSYVLRNPFTRTSSEIRQVLIQPTDAPGATFEIESIRLVFRKEFLAGIPSGVSWQGLSEIYRETIIARAPESIRMTMTLPARPWLDLSIGTVEDRSITFMVRVDPPDAGGTPAGKMVLLATVTRSQKWHRVPIDLTEYGGRRVTLSLSLPSTPPGLLGLWGSPVIRSHEAVPATTSADAASLHGGPPQGVIVIWADTVRSDDMDAYGYARATSPHLKQIAAEGAIFKDCVTQATWTKVATPSLLTSLYPATHGVNDFADRLPASAATIAEVYRDAGYATLSYSSLLFTGKFTGLQRGFEEVDEAGSLPDRRSSKTARTYVDRLIPWLQDHHDVPFFVFLHLSDPHDPYRPNPPYDTMWGDPSAVAEHEREQLRVREFISDPTLKAFGMPTRDELTKAGLDADRFVAQDRAWYDGAIRGMDDEIGRLLDRLRALGLDQKTLLVFASDHGEEFLEHGRMFHGQSTYGELSNVPLILRAPGRIPPGVSIPETVEVIDVMPTLLEMSGLRPPPRMQGRSFLSLLAASGGERSKASLVWRSSPAVTEKAVTLDVASPAPHDTESTAITIDGWKLIHNSKRPAGSSEFELYDERADPLNHADVAAAHQEIVERLKKDLDAWRAKAVAARLKPEPEPDKSLTPEELERLRSLGYIR
jgi:arylsulfatase A-like enzyme